MSRWERHLERMVNGTVQLGPRGWHWLWESKAGRTVIRRLAVTLIAAWAMYRLAGQWPWLWAVAVLLVLAQGYRSAAEDDVPDELELEDDAEDADLFAGWTREELLAALAETVVRLADGRAGVHLDRVREDWIERDLIQPCDLSDFRVFAEAQGLPVRDSVKALGTTRIGVRVAELPQAAVEPAAETPPPAAPDDLFQDW